MAWKTNRDHADLRFPGDRVVLYFSENHMGRKFGFSFSAKRAFGVSAMKGRISRLSGIPLTRQGRQRKVGRAMGCSVFFFLLAAVPAVLFAVSVGR